MVRAPYKDTPDPFRAVTGMTQGQTQDLLESVDLMAWEQAGDPQEQLEYLAGNIEF